jgi:transcription elongation factor Elf1
MGVITPAARKPSDSLAVTSWDRLFDRSRRLTIPKSVLRQRTSYPQIDGQNINNAFISPCHRNQKIREVAMANTGIDNCSPYGLACTECNDLLVAPKWSAYVSKHQVRHFWSCENCGHEIEMTINPRINAASKLSHGVEWSVVASAVTLGGGHSGIRSPASPAAARAPRAARRQPRC